MTSAESDSTKFLRFFVPGIPGPQGSKRFVGLSKAGRGIMIESSKKVRPWREAVVSAGLAAIDGHRIFDGPLIVGMKFYLPRPKSAPKSRNKPDRKPDLSKLIRSTEDAMTGLVITDDARIVELRATKEYAGKDEIEKPGCIITVERDDANPRLEITTKVIP